MFCKNCGKELANNAVMCPGCGVAINPTANLPPVSTYLVQSILVTIFCCWPCGIPAIIYAAKVNGLLASGNYDAAVEASKKAKMWSWIAFGLGLGIGLAYMALVMLGAIAGASGN